MNRPRSLLPPASGAGSGAHRLHEDCHAREHHRPPAAGHADRSRLETAGSGALPDLTTSLGSSDSHTLEAQCILACSRRTGTTKEEQNGGGKVPPEGSLSIPSPSTIAPCCVPTRVLTCHNSGAFSKPFLLVPTMLRMQLLPQSTTTSRFSPSTARTIRLDDQTRETTR